MGESDLELPADMEGDAAAPEAAPKLKGKKPTLQEIQLIQSILVASGGKLGKTGVKDRLCQVGDCGLGLTCINKIIQKLKTQTPEEIVAEHGKGRGRKPTKCTEALVAKIAARLNKNNSTLENSARKMAKELKVGKTVVNRVTKHVLKKKVFRKVSGRCGAPQRPNLAARLSGAF